MKLLKKVSFQEFFETNEEVAKSSPMFTHYNSPNPLEKFVWSRKKDSVKDLLDSLNISSIIDLGCGDASSIGLVKEKVAYTGVDISRTQLKYARDRLGPTVRKNISFVQADITDLKFTEDTFDAALVNDVVEHVLDPRKLFKEIKRVVKRGGYIIFCIPNEPLWQLSRAVFFRLPFRSPDHIYAIDSRDIHAEFPVCLKEIHLPFKFLPALSLLNLHLVKNVK